MDINEIRDAALLELHAMGVLSPPEIAEVETALAKYPELKQEYEQIQLSLQQYAQAYAIEPPTYLRERILSELSQRGGSQVNTIHSRSTDNASAKAKSFNWLPVALLSMIGAISIFFVKNEAIRDLRSTYAVSVTECDERTKVLEEKIKRYEVLQSRTNSIVKLDATEKYPKTKIYFHNNEKTKKNYLQVQKLPPLADNQSFQLWSLKGESDPIPLDVFDDSSELIEVDFIEDTNAYAITIEPLGGQEKPTLDNLVGVFKMSG